LAGAFEPTFTMTETRAARGSGVACRFWFTGSASGIPAPATAAGRERREVSGEALRCVFEEALWSGRPLVDATRFECW
jgi:hypothetical protein